MLTSIFFVVLTAAAFAAMLRGGRPERRVALILAADVVASGVVQDLTGRIVPAASFMVVDGLAFLALGRTAAFRPAPWLFAVSGLEAVIVGMDAAWLAPRHPSGVFYQHLAYGVGYVQLVLLSLAVAKRWIRPAPKTIIG